MSLVELKSVTRTFDGHSGKVVAVNRVDLRIDPGQTVAIVGESGSGKSTVGRLALGLLRPDSGQVLFDGHDLSAMSPVALRGLRADMQVVFQEPAESLDPTYRVHDIVAEPLRIHEPRLSPAARDERVREALDAVGLEPHLSTRRPHELSGGQQQRVGIARAIVSRPRFVVLDEPTASLDLSLRAQVLDLLLDLQSRLGLAYLLISHDMDSVAYIADRVSVMYAGNLLEQSRTETIFDAPLHPYTQALLASRPSIDPDQPMGRAQLVGDPSAARPVDSLARCVLLDRCPIREARCSEVPVSLLPVAADHDVACLVAQRLDVGHG